MVWEAGMQAHPQKFWFVENRSKIVENLGKNGGKCCLISKMAPNISRKTHEDLFLDVIPEKGLHDIWSLWGNFVGKAHTTFEQVWENSGKNPSHPQKFASPKPMCTYRFSNQIWMVFRHKRSRKWFWVVKLWFTIKNLEICVSVIFCHVVYWRSLVLGSSNSLQSCVCPSILDNNPP